MAGRVVARGEARHGSVPAPRSKRGAMDWDDVRVFLGVAREGSMRAAGRPFLANRAHPGPAGSALPTNEKMPLRFLRSLQQANR